MTRNTDEREAAQPPGGGTAEGDAGRLAGQLGASWQTCANAMLAWADAWGAVVTTRVAPVGEAAQTAVLKSMTDPASWPTALVPVLDEMRAAVTLPTFADLPRIDASIIPSPVPLLSLMKLVQDHAVQSLPVWIEAGRRFQVEAAARRGRDGAAASAGELLDVWNNVLDRTMMEFNRSGEFAEAQRRLLHAAAQQRREVRGAVERVARTVDLPTRTEMGDVYARLHEMRRELHALRREVRQLRAEARRPDAPQAAAPAGAGEATSAAEPSGEAGA